MEEDSITCSTRPLASPTIFDKEAIQSLPRHYIIEQLKENGWTDIAASLSPVPNPDEPIHETFKAIAAALREEREEQFDDMICTLSVKENSIRETFDTIVSELFKGPTHWGKMVTFIVFTSHLVQYCAQRRELRHKIPDLMEWTDAAMQEKLHQWIEQQGGWQAFVEHFDMENWRVSLSTFLLGLGVGVSLLAGGLLAMKKFLV